MVGADLCRIRQEAAAETSFILDVDKCVSEVNGRSFSKPVKHEPHTHLIRRECVCVYANGFDSAVSHTFATKG